MRILFITPYPLEGASTRHRIVVYFQLLASDGHQYDISPFMNERFFKIVYSEGKFLKKIYYFLLGVLKRFYDLLRAKQYDVIFIHLEAFPFGTVFFEKIMKFFNKNIIYDLDDAVYLKNVSNANSFLSFLKSGNKYKKIIKLSKAIVSCNDYLKDYASQINPLAIHQVIHTPLNTEIFRPKTKKNDKLIIGWIGSYSTSKYLELIKEPLMRLGEEFDFELNIVGAGKKIHFENVCINNILWTLDKDIENFQILDIGIYPLPDNEWVKGKTGFKTMQYMAVGIPCVVSAVGANLKIVQDGKNGFLAVNNDEWYCKLKLLMEDAVLRKKIGNNGRLTIIEYYSVDKAYYYFKKILNEVATS